MSNQYTKYPVVSGGGGSGNIADINGQVGPSINILAGTGISVNTVANNITIAATGGTVPTETVEYHTVSSGENTTKQFNLANTPLVPANVLVDVITGCAQYYSIDFTITGNVFDWNSLGLDGILSTGDVVRLHYLY